VKINRLGPYRFLSIVPGIGMWIVFVRHVQGRPELEVEDCDRGLRLPEVPVELLDAFADEMEQISRERLGPDFVRERLAELLSVLELERELDS
jgi:hypothetical protein